MMNILILQGSYRRHGNTSQILDLVAAHLRALADKSGTALQLETVYLGQEEIGACRGCRSCFDRGEQTCPIKDHFLALKARVQAADGVIFASPVYVDDVSGIMKTFIDRMAHVCHRPEFGGKCAYLIATVGGSPTGHTLGTLRMACQTWGFHVVGQAGFKMGALMKPADSRAQFERKTAGVARQFFDALRADRASAPSFFSLMMFRIQQLTWQQAGPGTLDYAYWQQKGWTNPETGFYFPHRASRVKAALARLVGTVIARFVS